MIPIARKGEGAGSGGDSLVSVAFEHVHYRKLTVVTVRKVGRYVIASGCRRGAGPACRLRNQYLEYRPENG